MMFRIPSPANATWSELGWVALIWFAGLVLIWLALVFRTGGF